MASNIFDIFKRLSESPSSSGPITHLIVGLGNPGSKYRTTRHNAGALALDYLAESVGVEITESRFKSYVADATVGGVRALLMKPQTFMNLSGEAVAEAAGFYKIPHGNIIVVSDDVSFEVGRVRIRRSGSDGGQKGLRSIITCLGGSDFPRIKVGIGRPPVADYDMADWVLSQFTKEEQKTLFDTFASVKDAITLMLSGKTDEAMNKFSK